MKHTLDMISGTAAIGGFSLVAMALFALGCKRHSPPAAPAPGAVVFEVAGISLVPGEGWREQRDSDLYRSQLGQICLPILEGQEKFAGDIIEVVQLPGSSDPEVKAVGLRKEIENQADVIRTSFRQEVFRTASGLRGTHIEYNEKAKDRTWLVRSHIYLVKSKRRCVGIVYLTRPNRDLPAVHQMIRTTLRLN